ncbi:hypothetical protein BKM14_21365 [Pseudomonas syringae pv. syringae]|nr:hypothetical protein BKM14_21365 [Pseudomonas syringae pv. syringae]POD51034.1 hypothetical protein BKM15_18895 [Pseudomonas syringae pv. syringae]
MRLLREESQGQSSLYLYEPGSYAPLARVDQQEGEAENKVYYFHTDQIGTPLEMTDVEGQIVWQAKYRAWGAVEKLVVNEVEQNLRFQGQYFDVETGLHYNTFRYYDPEIGRFITQDPIGLSGGDNLYQYAPNPYGWVDPLGLCKSSSGGAKEIGTITTRTTKNTTRLGGKAGEPGVKITYKDGTEFDMTSTRVKETEANPYVPGATRPIRHEDALDTKGIKRAPNQQELDWFNSIKW